MRNKIIKFTLFLSLISFGAPSMAFTISGPIDVNVSSYAQQLLQDISSGEMSKNPSFIVKSPAEIEKNKDLVSDKFVDFISSEQHSMLHEYILLKEMVRNDHVEFKMKGVEVSKQLPLNIFMTAWMDIVDIKVEATQEAGKKTFILRTFWFRHGNDYTLTRLELESNLNPR